MNSTYIQALEKRAQWLKWLEYEQKYQKSLNPEDDLYRLNLRFADMYVMNKQFCDLVDFARIDAPGDLKFELSWPPTKMGFMWLEKPFECPWWILDEGLKKELLISQVPGVDPTKVPVSISAIGWVAAERVSKLPDGRTYAETYTQSQLPGATPSAYSFLCFFDLGDHFEKWSYFTISPNDTIDDKVAKFEELAQKEGGKYNPDSIKFHEIRWVYTAMHLMSQKLAIDVEHETDRATKRRAEREKKEVSPKFKVVTLRRLYNDKRAEKFETEQQEREWKWQWTVQGHWRNQWYPKEQVHKKVFVEAYIKGPEDKPLKPPTQKIFVAKR